MSTEVKRVMTSAIPDMSVADVRKALQKVRKSWQAHDAMNPMTTTVCVTGTMSAGQFCFLFVRGHHLKRHAKSQIK